MDRVRPIGTQVKVVPPVYVELRAELVLRAGSEATDEALRAGLSAWLRSSGIGGTLRAGDAMAAVQAVPGVLQVREVSLRSLGPGCYQNEEGDLLLPRRAIPRLGALRTERLSDRSGGR